MPTYAYRCDACGHGFDAFQKFADTALTDCPACEGRIRRVIHPTPVVFKGSGWYINDSRAKPSANGSAAKADGDSTKTADAKDGAKAEPAKVGAAKADGSVAAGEKSSDKSSGKASAEKASAKVAAD